MRRWRMLAASMGLVAICLMPVHGDESQGQGKGLGQSQGAAPGGSAGNGTGKAAADRGKARGEAPLKDAIHKRTEADQPVLLPTPAADLGKSVRIEPPAKKLVQDGSALVPGDANPKVPPGLVRWHKDFADACAAASKSGKPVLLFQMMGRLDDRFC